jgi:hypothetical protein
MSAKPLAVWIIFPFPFINWKRRRVFEWAMAKPAARQAQKVKPEGCPGFRLFSFFSFYLIVFIIYI